MEFSHFISGFLVTFLGILLFFPNLKARQPLLIGLLVAATTHAVYDSRQFFPNSNFSHYYLGAKYSIPYKDFYSLLKAGQEKPQIGFRDLANPDSMIGGTLESKRWYYLRLFEKYDRLSPALIASANELLDEEHCQRFIQEEAKTILQNCGPISSRIASFKEDVSLTPIIFEDHGFNGSPLFAFIRRLDPFIEAPFSTHSYFFNVILQIIGLAAAIFLLQKTFLWETSASLFIFTLILSSRDYFRWVLPGLVGAGWFFPAALALYGMKIRKPLLCGFGIAWAGLIKIFPYILVVPIAQRLLASLFLSRQAITNKTDEDEINRELIFSGKALLAVLGFSGILILFTSGFPLSWSDFFQKILAQFVESKLKMNSVGISQCFSCFGVSESTFLTRTQCFSIVLVFFLTFVRSFDLSPCIPQRVGFLFLCCFGWLLKDWPNYYAVMTLAAFPFLFQSMPRFAALIIFVFGVDNFTQDFIGIVPPSSLFLLDASAYLLFSLALLFNEVKELASSKNFPNPAARQTALTFICLIGALLPLLLTWDVRQSLQEKSDIQEGIACIRQKEFLQAEALFSHAIQVNPANHRSQLGLGFSQKALGKPLEALDHFLVGLSLAPNSGGAHFSVGSTLLELQKPIQALPYLQKASQFSPENFQFRWVLGKTALQLGYGDEAKQQFRYALLLNPDLASLTKDIASFPQLF